MASGGGGEWESFQISNQALGGKPLVSGGQIHELGEDGLCQDGLGFEESEGKDDGDP